MLFSNRDHLAGGITHGKIYSLLLFSAILLILQSTATLLFFPILAFRVYLSLRGGSILMLWVALELNMVRVLPLLRFESGTYGGEVRIKYFLVQA